MADPDTGWAVGMAGELLYTTDGGSTWNAQSSGTNAPLLGVDAHDGLIATTVGGFPPIGTMNGTIINTSDGGSNWNAASPGVPYVFTDVFFIDPTEGWIVGAGGGTIYHTTDGGSTWSDQSTTGDSLLAVHFVMPSVGWVAADDGEVLSTGDGGNSWSTFATPTGENLHDIHFTGLSTGWAVGDHATILKTTDGGSSWTLQYAGGSDLRSVHFINANEGWAVGKDGTVLHTTDGGSNWNFEASSSSEDLHSVHFPVDSIGWAVGTNGEIIVYKGCMPKSSSIAPTVCDSFLSPDGDTTYTTSGNYRDTLTVQGGNCDSIVNIDLTVHSVNPSVIMPSPGELMAQDTGVSYQWLDCDDGHAPISGETGQSFKPSSSGDYAVEVSANGCTDTSSCHSVQNVGIEEGGADGQELSIAPNPTNGELQIRFGALREDVTLRVMDLTGRVIERRHYDARSRIRYRIEGEPGLYFIELEDMEGRKQVWKVVKE